MLYMSIKHLHATTASSTEGTPASAPSRASRRCCHVSGAHPTVGGANTLQRTTTHCNTLHAPQRAATRRNTPQHAAIDTVTHYNMLQQATHHESYSLTATRCNTLQHTATNNPTSHARPERGSYFLTHTSYPLNESCHIRISHVTCK